MYQNIIENVKSIIKEQGVKQCVVAQRVGFSQTKFSNMLNGRYIVKAGEIPSICKALGVTPNELFSPTENQAS